MPYSKKGRHKHLGLPGGCGIQPETYKVIEPFKEYLEKKGWVVYNIRGIGGQISLPDKLCFHKKNTYSPRWMEAKYRSTPVSKHVNLHGNQSAWHNLVKMGFKFHVIAAHDLRDNEPLCNRLYHKIFLGPPNQDHLLNKNLNFLLFG